jgi:predicted RNase H-like HicB family nuclease
VKNEFSVIIEDCGDGWYWAHSPEVPAANGQGRSPDLAKADLVEAIKLVLDYLRDKAEAEIPPTAIRDVVRVG